MRLAAAVLVVNAGSSSLKFSLYPQGEERPALRGLYEELERAPRFSATSAQGEVVARHSWGETGTFRHAGAIAHLLAFLGERAGGDAIAAVGHRVVHGGATHDRPVRVTGAVVAELARLVPLAPLHQPHALAAIQAITAHAPALPQVACFDTAFHRAMPATAQSFALPPQITARGVRRYGFHGLSYESIAQTLRDVDPAAARGRVVVAHLGNGASMCAMSGGHSVATTMGFTPLDGLVMGTRCGALDPGVVIYLLDELGMDARAIEQLLYRESGLLGVSELSSDMRTLLASPDPRAGFAVDLFCYRIVRELGSLAAALGGLDALVFTGGIGEHAAPVRERVMRDAAWLGLDLDAAANRLDGPRLTSVASRIPAYALATDEELVILRHARELLA